MMRWTLALLVAANLAAAQTRDLAAELRAIGDQYWTLVVNADPETAFGLGVDSSDGGVLKDTPWGVEAGLKKEFDLLSDRLAAVKAQAAALTPAQRVDLEILERAVASIRHDAKAGRAHADIIEYIESPVYYLSMRQNLFSKDNGTEVEWGQIARILEGLDSYYLRAQEVLATATKSGRIPYRHLVEKFVIPGCLQAAEYFEKGIPARARVELGESNPLYSEILRNGETAAAAVKRFREFLIRDVLPSARGDFALGEEETNRRLKYVWGVDSTVDQALARLQERGKAVDARFKTVEGELSRQLGVTPEEIPAKIMVVPKNDAEIMAHYRQAADRAERFIRKTGLVPLPPDYRIRIKPIPDGIQGLSAYYMPLPIFRDDVGGSFFVPQTQGDPAKRVDQNSLQIVHVTVHEALPGHDVQFRLFRQARSLVPKSRWLSPSSANLEGWAMYATDLMRRRGFFTKAEEYYDLLIQRGAISFAQFDLLLNSGRMRLQEVVDLFRKHYKITAEAARDYLFRSYRAPLQSSAYILGQMEIERLKEDYRRRMGTAYSEQAFHRAFLSQGPIAPSLIRCILLPDVESMPRGAAGVILRPTPAAKY